MLAIETRNLTKNYGNKTAVDQLNLNIEEGELFALLGVNGAGKTTAIKMMSTLAKQTDGEIYINGKALSHNLSEIRNTINLSPQETAVAPNLSVTENLQFIAGIYNIRNKREKIVELMNLFGLNEVKKQKAKTLSGGWQKRLSIAMALINEPRVLFLDEPTASLDVIARRELWSIIKSLKGKMTIILTTHYMEEAEYLSDRIGIMVNGKLKCIGTCEELTAHANAKNFEDAFVALATEEKK